MSEVDYVRETNRCANLGANLSIGTVFLHRLTKFHTTRTTEGKLMTSCRFFTSQMYFRFRLWWMVTSLV